MLGNRLTGKDRTMQKLLNIAEMRRDAIKKEIADELPTRLRAVMRAFGLTYQTFGEAIGVGYSTVTEIMRGAHLPRVPEMLLLCERTGLTLGWIYAGSEIGIDEKLAAALVELIASGDETKWRVTKGLRNIGHNVKS
jgi:transcriptional regulator with XRE-family HTH domain